MSVILNIETATKNCSVSLAQNGNTIVCKQISGEGYSHAEKLHVFIEQVVSESGKSFVDVDAIAVSRGPGSYTGLRIGVSAAKGLCYALGIPLIAVDTLKILAAQANVKDGVIIPMLDARRMEVYSAIYSSDLTEIRETRAEIITADSFSEISGNAYLLGDANEKCKTELRNPNFIFLDDAVFPSADEMSALSFQKFENTEFEDVAYFEPFYLKDFVLNQKR